MTLKVPHMNCANSAVNSWFGYAKSHCFSDLKERLQGNKYFVPYLIVTALFLSMWHSRVTHRFSLRAFAVFAIFCALCLIYGRVFIKLTPLSFKSCASFPIQFLFGYLLLNSLLFLLLVFTRLGIAANVFILAGGGLLFLLCDARAAPDVRTPPDYLPDFLCLLLSGMAATLWCTDLLSPVLNDGQNTVYRTYIDGFFHVREISNLAQAHGWKSICDIRMAGHPTGVYHYAIYVAPAAISYFTASSAYTAFVSFLVPFGILLVGLAAFSLAGSIWGTWPGIAATLAVSWMPDAYQQGFGSKYLSYNFLQQAAPGGSYGIVCASIAWMFVLEGCKNKRFVSIIIGYVVLLTCIAYRAHFFVANAFLLMIYPCFFFPGLRLHWRIISAAFLTALFAVVLTLSQGLPGVPTLRFDRIGEVVFARRLLGGAEPGLLKAVFYKAVYCLWEVKPLLVLPMAGFLVLATFGLWTAALLVIPFLNKMRIGAAAFFFPFLVLVNYLVMSLGLAMDTKGIGRPEELLHRPFVWAYFVVAAWTGAGTYAFLIGNQPPRSRAARTLAALFAMLTFSVPLFYGRDIQTVHLTAPSFKRLQSYKMFNSVPSDLIKACLYIRKHSDVKDVIQDSEDDPRFVVTALAERQSFVAACQSQDNDTEGTMHIWSPPPEELLRRCDQLAGYTKLADESSLTKVMQNCRISWYILHPGTEVAWPVSFLKKAVFCRDGYRVFHFSP